MFTIVLDEARWNSPARARLRDLLLSAGGSCPRPGHIHYLVRGADGPELDVRVHHGGRTENIMRRQRGVVCGDKHQVKQEEGGGGGTYALADSTSAGAPLEVAQVPRALPGEDASESVGYVESSHSMLA